MTWTTTPPTVPGMYAIWNHDTGVPYWIEISIAFGELYDPISSQYVDEFNDGTYWCGPYLLPEPPTQEPTP